MLMKDITPGRQVWFQESGVGENGKNRTPHVPGYSHRDGR